LFTSRVKHFADNIIAYYTDPSTTHLISWHCRMV